VWQHTSHVVCQHCKWVRSVYFVVCVLFYITHPACHTPPRTAWRRLIECLKLQVIFRKRATKHRALLQKMTYEDKASYDSTLHVLYTTKFKSMCIAQRGLLGPQKKKKNTLGFLHIVLFVCILWSYDMTGLFCKRAYEIRQRCRIFRVIYMSV